MRKTRKLRAAMAMLLIVATAAPMVSGGAGIGAAKKPKLSNSKLSVKIGSSKTLKVKNCKNKVTWKSSKASVVKLAAINKTSVKITGKKKGTTKVTASFKLAGRTRKLICTVTVSSASAPTEPPATEPPTSEPVSTATMSPEPVPTATVDPDITAAPSPTFDYDHYEKCLWKQPEGVRINEVFKDYFISGVSTNLGHLRFKEESALTRYHFGSISMGNETKMETIVSDNKTDEYPKGYAKANVDQYYAAKAAGVDEKVILDYETLENTLKYIKEQGLKMRYHTFVWHSQVREYFFLEDYNWNDYNKEDYAANGWDVNNYHRLASRETMEKRLVSYIDQVIEYIYSHGYGDVVYAYDVINEATNGATVTYYINEDATTAEEVATRNGSGTSFGTNPGVRTSSGKLVTVDSSPEDVENMLGHEGRVPANDSYWYATLGPDYLYLSFYAARKAIDKYYEQYKEQFGYTVRPSLIYNDYNGNASQHVALAKYINLACNLKDGTKGVKFCDGIGIQAHNQSPTNQEGQIKTIVNAGLEVQITELDWDVYANKENQARNMKALYELYMKYSKNGEYGKTAGDDYIGVTSVTQWGIRDGVGSWKGQYMFEDYEDENEPMLTLQPKPAYFAVLQAGGIECGSTYY